MFKRFTSGSGNLLSTQQILSLYLPSMVLALGSSMIAPIIPGFAKSFDVELTTAALVFVAFNLGGLAITFPSGYLIDKIGRRPILLAGPLIEAVASLATPFSPSFSILLICRFVSGAANQMWQQSRLAMIADTTASNERARQVQWMMGVARGGQLFGPAIGGILAANFGLWVPFVAYGILELVIVFPSFRLIKESRPDSSSQARSAAAAGTQVGWRGVFAYLFTFHMMVFMIVQFSGQMARGGQDHGALSLYAVYAFDLGPQELGFLNTAATIVSLPVPFITGYLMDRFGRRAVIVPGWTSYAIAVGVMAMTSFLPMGYTFFLFAYLLVQATGSTTGGSMQVMGTDLAPAFARGRFFSIWRMISQLGATVSPAVFAFIAAQSSYGAGFLYLGACSLLVSVLVAAVLGNTLARADAGDRKNAEPGTVPEAAKAEEKK